MKINLNNILMAQGDFGQKTADQICDDVLMDKYESHKDPIADVIVKAYNENEPGDWDGVETDIRYAISQLARAADFLKTATAT